MVTKWIHDVTRKSGCFLASGRGDFSKNSVILDLAKMGCFGGVGGKPSPFEFACIINLENFWSEKNVR